MAARFPLKDKDKPYVDRSTYELDEGRWRMCDTCGEVYERCVGFIPTSENAWGMDYETTCKACRNERTKARLAAEPDTSDGSMYGITGVALRKPLRPLAGGMLSPDQLKRHLRRAELHPPNVCPCPSRMVCEDALEVTRCIQRCDLLAD